MKLSLPLRILSWVLQIVAALILLQTLFFKFSGAKESIYIFSRIGAEPWGRIGSGVAELIVALLLLHPRTVVFGAIGAVMIMVGAIGAHLTVLGISVENDGGLLFGLAMAVFISGLMLIVLHRQSLPVVGPWFAAPSPVH
jgi:uncharacterized membrane protein YphA (DoxX/SURF4 family)